MAGKYYPYGEDRGTPIQNDQVKYATYTRDSATGMDYADQRYYSNQFGRFMTADRYMASGGPSDPGSWNRYAYVGGDPNNFGDAHGLYRNLIGNCSNLVDGEPQDACNGAEDNISGGGSTCFADGFNLGFDPNPLCSSYEELEPEQPTQAYVLVSLFGTPDGTYGSVNFDYTGNGDALTTPNGIPTPSFRQGFRGSSATVSIKSTIWNIDNVDFNAETLLHELGHVYNFVRGSGGFALPNSAELTDGKAFDKLIQMDCNIPL